MKTYKTFSELERIELTRRKDDELLLFQRLLRDCPQLNDRYHGTALEIAVGLLN